jgi:hypothetical protein
MAGVKSILTGKSENVIRVLLVDYPKTWKLRDLAKAANVSLRWASVVSGRLIRERIALRESERAELKLMTPEDLLRRWANYQNFVANTKFLEYYSKEEDVSKLFEKFKGEKGPEYAFTALAGALLTAPFVRPTNVHIYVKTEEDAKIWANLLGLIPVEENGNVKFAITKGEGVFYGSRTINGVNVISDIQLYVDLLNYPGRGEEAAAEVKKVIETRWKEKK